MKALVVFMQRLLSVLCALCGSVASLPLVAAFVLECGE
jgi:hypothetical protein